MPSQILDRKRWANVHQKWSMGKWATVAFSEDSTFTQNPTTLCKRVWRKQGKRFKIINLVPSFKSGYEFIAVWDAFSMCRSTPLIRIEGNFNQHKYIEILKSTLTPFAQQYHCGTGYIIIQQHGCVPHRAKSVKTYLDG